MTLQQNTLDIHQKQVPLFRMGTGAPVLYLHGIHGDLFSIEQEDGLPPFHRALAQRFDCIAPAHPGFADAGPSLEHIDTMEDMVLHYLDLLELLDLQGLSVVGHCLGGWIAAELAVRCTHRLAKLVLIGACGLYVEKHRIGDFFHATAPKSEGGRAELRDLLFRESTGELANRLVPDEPSEHHNLMLYRAQVTAARVGWSPPYLHSMKLRSRLYRIHLPTLLVWGDSDKLVPPEHAEAYCQGIRDALVTQIPGAGHCVVAEKPEEVAEAVISFLQ